MLGNILLPIAALGGLGLLFGADLAFASKKFAVAVDPRTGAVRELLPGANCGACGHPGCDGFAAAIVLGKAPVDGCPVGGCALAETIGSIMGIEVQAFAPKVAKVLCQGTCDKAVDKYVYSGIKDCLAASMLFEGPKGCKYGCMGLGTCERVCPFDAIHVTDQGIAAVDPEKCTACNQCVAACPKNIIELIPKTAKVQVLCVSKDNAKAVKANCQVGCIGCRICVKACPVEAIGFGNNLARINYDKCTQCMVCVEKCPTKAIAAHGARRSAPC
jgi:electron transport complex protein RnfB